MSARRPERTRLHMVWSRPIDGVPMAGRPNVARQIRAMLAGSGFAISESTIRPLTSRMTAFGLIGAALRLLGGLLRGRPLPLQCALFGARDEAQRALAAIPADCRLVYLDGVRCLRVLELLRRTRPELAVVTDLDDLMSRRMELLLSLDQPPSTGYLKGQMPALVERMLRWRLPARLVLRYEGAALRSAERRIAALSDAVTLISSEDARLLRQRAPGCDVRAIGFGLANHTGMLPRLEEPFRFVFIGTDALRQNQLTIETLLALWRRERIETPLVIYGEQQGHYDLPARVTMPGYAESLDAVYDPHTILLTPSYVAGGIKTKVLESFAYSRPVIGNPVTFEAIAIDPAYPLLFADEAAMLPVLRAPERYRERFAEAVAMGKMLLHEHHDPDRIARAWHQVAITAMERHGAPATPAIRRISALPSPVLNAIPAMKDLHNG